MARVTQFVVWLLLLIPVSMKAQTESKPSLVALKTNLLYDALLVPNIGIEVSLGKQWTVAGEGMLAWWSSDRNNRYWQTYGGYLTVSRSFFVNPLAPSVLLPSFRITFGPVLHIVFSPMGITR